MNYPILSKYLSSIVSFGACSDPLKLEIESFQKQFGKKKIQTQKNLPPKKIMKYVSPITTGKETIDLFKFYLCYEQDKRLRVWGGFQKVIEEACCNDRYVVEVNNEVLHRWKNLKDANEDQIIAEMGEKPFDLNTPYGRLGARKRLAVLAIMLKKQAKPSKDKVGTLQANGRFNVALWVKRRSGSLYRMEVYSAKGVWFCGTPPLQGPDQYPNTRFWSKNGEAK